MWSYLPSTIIFMVGIHESCIQRHPYNTERENNMGVLYWINQYAPIEMRENQTKSNAIVNLLMKI